MPEFGPLKFRALFALNDLSRTLPGLLLPPSLMGVT